jgi:hypothetical protein
MRVIFLDFDGVIMTYRTAYCRTSAYPVNYVYNEASEGKWGMIDPIACQFLHNICKIGKIAIVISSTWRCNPENCMRKLKEANLFEFLHEDWRTEQSDAKRGVQVANWLKMHPDVKSYRILDDDFGTAINTEQERVLVQCDTFDGLGGREMKKLLEWAIQ